ncbi:MAG: TetR/AcrR family transcriptional regulator [Gordonibacter sp.]|uniref:TetR/AcrR family transcriptional regulator n=1 Tax=Gordonibacter sp. TaxID=1968902 RepID=UPI002FC76D01
MGKSVQTKGQKTKQKLFETAIQLINECGYDEVTVADICEAAQVAKGTFYVHYAAKDDIIRESYYTDMGAFVEEHYQVFIAEYAHATVRQRIKAFLLAELAFPEYTGVEVTSLAFSANFAACAPGTSEHLKKRVFMDELKKLIEEAGFSNAERVFLDLETIVRGYMASWCFGGGAFDIIEEGERLLDWYLDQADLL